MAAPKFLIVDDDEQTRKLMEVILASFGCETESVKDGETAIEVLSKPENAEVFDAIFLDLLMPRLSGYAVLQQLRQVKHTQELPVIIMTSQGKYDEILEGYNMGGNYYLVKPFNRAQVEYALNSVFAEEEPGEDVRKKRHVLDEA